MSFLTSLSCSVFTLLHISFTVVCSLAVSSERYLNSSAVDQPAVDNNSLSENRKPSIYLKLFRCSFHFLQTPTSFCLFLKASRLDVHEASCYASFMQYICRIQLSARHIHAYFLCMHFHVSGRFNYRTAEAVVA